MNSQQRTERTLETQFLRYVAPAAISIALVGLNGCSFSPSVNIAGSYFPAWIICCLVAIAVTAVAHAIFTRWNLLNELWPLPVIYPCLICFVSCLLWLTFFR